MLKDLINSDSMERSFFGVSVYRVKKNIVTSFIDENFTTHYSSLLLIKSGRFKLQIGETVFDLVPYDLMILPEKLVCSPMENEGKLQFFLLVFSAGKKPHGYKFSAMNTSFYLYGNKPLQLNLESVDYQVLSLICRLLHTVGSNRESNESELEFLRLSSSLLLFELKYLYSKYISSSSLYLSKSEVLTVQFLNILSIHCRKHHNVKFYAGSLYVTPEYLNRAVKEVLDKTTKMMITEAVLVEAANMLEDSNYSIAEIAEELEFGSSNSFGVFFKKWMHCTPSEYRSNAVNSFKSR